MGVQKMRINKKINFMGHKKYYFIFSVCLMLTIALCTVFMGVELDIQFKGGTIVSYSYTGDISSNDIKSIAEKTLNKNVSINMKNGFSGKDSFEISLVDDEGISSDKQTALTNALKSKFTANNLDLLSNNSVAPTIGREFFAKSLIGVAFAALIIVIYIALRFKKISGWSAGVMAIIALANDLATVFGVFVIFKIPLDYNFIAVLLTILGYSVNDTIVIYDRIRENDRLYGRTITRSDLVNNSINDTFTRTVNTSVTTIMSMIVICIVSLLTGVTSIMSFAFPMLFGLVSGTYSTICLAGPLWVIWQDRKEKKRKEKHNTKKQTKNK